MIKKWFDNYVKYTNIAMGINVKDNKIVSYNNDMNVVQAVGMLLMIISLVLFTASAYYMIVGY